MLTLQRRITLYWPLPQSPTHVTQLRKEIEASPDSPAAIATMRGVGYRFDARGGRGWRSRKPA